MKSYLFARSTRGKIWKTKFDGKFYPTKKANIWCLVLKNEGSMILEKVPLTQKSYTCSKTKLLTSFHFKIHAWWGTMGEIWARNGCGHMLGWWPEQVVVVCWCQTSRSGVMSWLLWPTHRRSGTVCKTQMYWCHGSYET